MNADKDGKLNGNYKSNKVQVCVHQRMMDCHFNATGQPSGNLVCRECGAVLPDPAKVLWYR